MKNTKIIRFLNKIDEKELYKFEDFLFGKCSKSHKRLPKLLAQLKKFHPNFDSRNFTEETVFKKIYTNEIYDKSSRKKLQNHFSDLRKYFEEFLITQAVEKNQILKSKLLTQELGKLNLQEQFQKQATTCLINIEATAPFDEEDYLNLYQIRREIFFHSSANQTKITTSGLPDVLDHIHHFYQLTMLKYGLEIINRNRQLKYKEELPITYQKLRLELKSHSCDELPKTIEAYLKLTELFELSRFNPATFKKIKAFCKTHFENLAKSEQATIIAYLRIFVSQNYYEDNVSAKEELFGLLEFSLTKGLLLVDGIFPYLNFVNLVLLAVDFKEMIWIRNLVTQYSDQITKDFRKDTLNYIECYLLFKEGKYLEVYQLSQKLQFKKAHFSFLFRSLLIRNHYELTKIDSNHLNILDTYLNACRRFFHRNRILGKRKEQSYQNFVEMSRRLTKCRFGKKTTKQKIEQLKNRLKTYQFLTLQEWLTTQIDDIQQHHKI